MPRKSIPKTLKNQVWDTYVGKKHGVGKCFCCKKEIDSKIFDCGHVVSVKMGGPTTVENMRPVCATCNKSMGEKNMMSFKKEYFPSNENLADKIIKANVNVARNFFLKKIFRFK